MPGKAVILESGKVGIGSAGKAAITGDDGCPECCAGECVGYGFGPWDGFSPGVGGGGWRIAGTTWTGMPEPSLGHKRCRRLLVYLARGWASSALTGSDVPDHELATAGSGIVEWDGVPFETTKGSGIFLDDVPYWWPCGESFAARGFALTTVWRAPTLAELTTMILTNAGATAFMASGKPHRLFVSMIYYTRRTAQGPMGGPHTYGDEDDGLAVVTEITISKEV